jgi:hypothetical protein
MGWMTMEIVPASVVLTAIIAIVWLSRARATKRFQAALAVYAEREIRRHEAGRASSTRPPEILGAASELGRAKIKLGGC